MSMFTPKQRAVLQRRLELGIAWQTTDQYKRDDARRIAKGLVDELDEAGFSAGTARRAIENIVARLEQTA